MPEINLMIPGIPGAQKRHRHVRQKNFVRTYDPSADDKMDFLFKAIYDQKPGKLITSAIAIFATFYMKRPKSHYGTGKNAGILKKTAHFRHTSKPDVDNQIKYIFDALNGTYYKDDSQIFSIRAEKRYDENPRTEIRLIWEP